MNVNVSSSSEENANGKNFFESALSSISLTNLARSIGSFVDCNLVSRDFMIGRATGGRVGIGFITFWLDLGSPRVAGIDFAKGSMIEAVVESVLESSIVEEEGSLVRVEDS